MRVVRLLASLRPRGTEGMHNLFFPEGLWAVKRHAQVMAVDRYVDEFVALVAVCTPVFHIADALERNALGATLSRAEAAR